MIYKILGIIFSLTLLLNIPNNNYDDLLSIHIIDVGQGDSILIKTPSNKSILIDSGNEDSENIVLNYLDKEDISTINILIATHVDADHIGSMDAVINNFNVNHFFMPNQIYDTNAYYNLIDSCKSNDLDINHLYKDDYITLEDDIKLDILSPINIVEDNNLNSIVFKLQHKNKSFLFTGDSELENENDMINNSKINDIDFLKVGRHGSSSSSSEEFIEIVSPDISVISCGYKNQYNHPHQDTLQTLSSIESLVYRTDLNGSMIFYSDGYSIFSKKEYKE